MERGKFSLPRSIHVSLRIKLSHTVENDRSVNSSELCQGPSPVILILSFYYWILAPLNFGVSSDPERNFETATCPCG